MGEFEGRGKTYYILEIFRAEISAARKWGGGRGLKPRPLSEGGGKTWQSDPSTKQARCTGGKQHLRAKKLGGTYALVESREKGEPEKGRLLVPARYEKVIAADKGGGGHL